MGAFKSWNFHGIAAFYKVYYYLLYGFILVFFFHTGQLWISDAIYDHNAIGHFTSGGCLHHVHRTRCCKFTTPTLPLIRKHLFVSVKCQSNIDDVGLNIHIM